MIYILLTLFQKVQWGCDILVCLIYIYIFPFQWKCCSVIINCTRNLVISLLIYRSTTLITRIVHSSLESPPFWYTLLCIQKCINKTVFWTGQLFVSDRCMYQGHAYSQGQGWKVSCDTECVCENAIYGYYRCTNTYVHFQLYKRVKYICTCLEMFGYSFQILKHYDLILHVYLYW